MQPKKRHSPSQKLLLPSNKPSIVVCHEVILQTQESNSTLSKFLTSTNPKLFAKSPLANQIR